MELGTQQFSEKFFEAVKMVLPSDVKIFYICLIGSQGKNLATPESDYDIRAIVVNPLDDYVLQRPKPSYRIETTFEGKSLEGTAMDIVKVCDIALETNLFVLDVLRGIPIYNNSPKLMEELRKVTLEAYSPLIPMSSLESMMHRDLKRKMTKGKGEYLEKVPVKVIVETMFIILEMRCLFAKKNLADYFNIDKMVDEFAGKDAQLMKDMITIRRQDKKQEVIMGKEIKGMIQDILSQVSEYINSYPLEEKQKAEEKRKWVRPEADQICVEIIKSTM